MNKVLVKKNNKEAKVNWYRDGKLGLTYLTDKGEKERTSTGNVMCDVLREDEVEFKFGEIKPDSKKKDVREERSVGDLKERLRQIRREAKELTQKKRKKTRKSNKKKKKKKPPKSPKEVLRNMTEEEIEALKDML